MEPQQARTYLKHVLFYVKDPSDQVATKRII